MSEDFEKELNEDLLEESETYPVMPLRNTVLFPQQVIPIYIGRDKSLKLINELPSQSKHIVVVAQEDGSIENPEPDEMYSFGTLAVVLKVFDMPDNSKSAIVQGIDRVKILDFNSNKDQTDFELALNYLEEAEKSKVYIIGGESGEIDHLISIFLLIPSKSFFENIIWLYGDKRIIFRQKLELNIKKLTKFSVIPLTDLTNLSIDGAEWNLDNKDIQFGETLTLRNNTNEEQLNIRCDKGVFALIY